MTDEPVMFHDQLQAHDKRSHIDRINPNPPGYSDAWLPNAARFHPRGAESPPRKPRDPRSFPEPE